MISNRPILYLTLPSLALIIGYVWLRRKKGGRAVCDTGGKEQSSSSNKSCKLLGEGLGDNQELSDQAYSAHNSQHTESLPIGTPKQQKKQLKLNLNQSPPRNKQPGEKQQSQSPGSAASSSSSLGKSAPIDIAPNPRSPPKRVTEQEIDCEILKLKPQESDIKHLRYIEEPEIDWDESPTPADSPLYRDRFDLNRSQPKVEPVVIKGTLEAKISPENSFRERKYTQTEADDSAHLKESAKAEETNSKMENGTAATDNGCVMMQEDAEVVAATSTTAEVPKKSQSDVCIEPQIASPSLSVCSMHSGDSGQGSSPPQSVGAPQVTYDFMIPPSYVGALIGFRGSIITNIKDKTGANVVIRKSIPGKKHKVCSIEGTQSEVDAALKLIRVKMPEKRYPYMSMERIFVTPDNKVVPTFNASTLHLQLIEGINNDVTISNIVSGGHLFLHQPLHPSYPSLSSLQHRMNQWYSMTTAPELPEIIDSAICALCVQDNWYRVQIVSHSSQAKTSIVKYLDFGGFMTVKSSELRQIHADFMSVPFQAIECVLSNIRAPGDGEWSQEAADTITSFTQGVIMQAQIAGYTQDELPEIYLYVSITKDNVLFINQELCARQLAEWVPNEQEG